MACERNPNSMGKTKVWPISAIGTEPMAPVLKNMIIKIMIELMTPIINPIVTALISILCESAVEKRCSSIIL